MKWKGQVMGVWTMDAAVQYLSSAGSFCNARTTSCNKMKTNALNNNTEKEFGTFSPLLSSPLLSSPLLSSPLVLQYLFSFLSFLFPLLLPSLFFFCHPSSTFTFLSLFSSFCLSFCLFFLFSSLHFLCFPSFYSFCLTSFPCSSSIAVLKLSGYSHPATP